MKEVTLKEVSKSINDLVNKGMASMERENFDYAMDVFIIALEQEPYLLEARTLLAAAALKKHYADNPNPLKSMVAFLQGIPLMVSALLLMKKDPQAALMKTETLMRLDPLNMVFVGLLARASESANMPEVAVRSLSLVREHKKGHVGLLRWLLRLHKETGDTRQARDVAKEIVRLRPNDGHALKVYKDITAMDTMSRGGWDGAKSYRDVIKDKDQAELLEQEGASVASDESIENMIASVEKKIEQEPKNVTYLRQLADLYTRDAKFEDALKALARAREVSGGADPQIDQLYSQTEIKKYEHEIAELEKTGDQKAVEEKKMELDKFHLSNASEQTRRYPNDMHLKYIYGLELFKHEDFKTAIKQFQQSQRSSKDRINSLYYLGLSFKAVKQYDIALEQLEKASSEKNSMDDTKKDILYALGELCEIMDLSQKALDYYKEIYSVDIEYKDISEKVENAS